jgi:hypothetical protein
MKENLHDDASKTSFVPLLTLGNRLLSLAFSTNDLHRWSIFFDFRTIPPT